MPVLVQIIYAFWPRISQGRKLSNLIIRLTYILFPIITCHYFHFYMV